MAKKSSIFINLLNLDPDKIQAIDESFNDLDEIFKASGKSLNDIRLLNDKDTKKILALRDSDCLEKELLLIEKENVKCIDIFDLDYPRLLKEIAKPPIVLYLKGKYEFLNRDSFAIVGSRLASSYGTALAYEFASGLSKLGIAIVSGLAKGIDTFAHRGALENGITVAVLGSGLCNIYPKENYCLARDIVKQGALISEFPLLTLPLKENFPRRNRIVSGLSKGVLIIEAAERSGALITANLASEQNREVFSIPGRIDSQTSKGTNSLIKEGAKLVDSLSDILDELNISFDCDLPKDAIFSKTKNYNQASLKT